MSNIHRGNALHKAAKRHKFTIKDIAEGAGYTLSTFYKHTAQENLDFVILNKYAKVMNYYFDREIPDFTMYLQENNLRENAGDAPSNRKELLSEMEYWKNRAYEAKRRAKALLQQNRENDKDIQTLREELQRLKSKKS